MQALTVGEMKAAGWTVRAVCRACRTTLWADLDVIVRTAGADELFWGRHPRCKVWTWGDDERCPGRVTFEARSVRGGTWRALRMTSEVQDCWRLRQVRQQARP